MKQSLQNVCCEVGAGCISRLNICSGKEGSKFNNVETDDGGNVVCERVKDFLGLGHLIYRDNFLTSIPLAVGLMAPGTDATGKLHANRISVPLSLKEKKLKKGEEAWLPSRMANCCA